MVRCYDCARPYQLCGDLVLSDELWEKINPSTVPGGGILCPNCILTRLGRRGLGLGGLSVMIYPPVPDSGNEQKQVKLVKQLDRSGCGIACVAMVTGRSYEEVRALYLSHFAAKRDGLPDDFQLIAGGNGAGIPLSILERMVAMLAPEERVSFIPFPNAIIKPIEIDLAPPHGILGSHFIVIDEMGNKLDPAVRPTNE